jgi:hypothetical protein
MDTAMFLTEVNLYRLEICSYLLTWLCVSGTSSASVPEDLTTAGWLEFKQVSARFKVACWCC